MSQPQEQERCSARKDPAVFHRTDIDFLRVFAIVSVVLFHASFIRGGFVGVDVFFVISGYLMASILDEDHRQGRFSFSGFYLRRARRIVPAFVFVLVCVGLAGSILMLPDDVKSLGKSMISASYFGTNFLFQRDATDYFASDSLVFEPLLHTWSLAVEAQYYIVFPLILWGLNIWRPSRGFVLLSLAGLFLLSCAYSAWSVQHNSQQAFYMLPSRMGELLVGALVYFFPPLSGRLLRLFTGSLGIALLFTCSLFYSDSMPFPGLAALPVVLGTAAFLLVRGGGGATEGGFFFRMSSSWPVAWGAKLSYSLYLWHWPLFVFARYRYGDELPAWLSVAVIGLSLCLSLLTYIWIERPFLSRKVHKFRTTHGELGFFFLLLITLFLFGVVVKTKAPRYIEGALPQEVIRYSQGKRDREEGDCRPFDLGGEKRGHSGKDKQGTDCRMGDLSRESAFILWGNSFARMWIPALREKAEESGVAGDYAIKSACWPVVTESVSKNARPECEEFSHQVTQYILSRKNLTWVVLAGNWRWSDTFEQEMRATISLLVGQGLRVYVVLNPPRPDYLVPRTLALAALRGGNKPPLQTLLAYEAEMATLKDVFRRLEKEYGIRVIEPALQMCRGGVCLVEKDGRPLYFDEAHITNYASRMFSDVFSPLFDDIKAEKTR